jgi:hypothetical protein
MNRLNATNRVRYERTLMLAVMLLTLVVPSSHASDFRVKDVAEFEKAIYQAQAGDVIWLLPGIYPDVRVSINVNSVVITGVEADAPPVFTGRTSFTISGDNIVLRNMIFSEITSGSILRFAKGSGSSIEDSIFIDCGNNEIRWRHLVHILPDAENVSVIGNEFERSKSMSVGVVINRDAIGGHHVISSNIFTDTIRSVDNGLEPVQIGQKKEFHHVESYITVKNNVFRNVKGDQESVSLKSSKNIVSGNLFHDSSSLTLRGGESNKIVGNCFLDNTVGIRIYGKGHLLSRNIFIANGMALYRHVPDKESLHHSTHKRVESILLDGNIFLRPDSVNDWTQLVSRRAGYEISDFYFSNNQFYLSRLRSDRMELKRVQVDNFHDQGVALAPKRVETESAKFFPYVTADGISPLDIQSAKECNDVLNLLSK